jgi:hypothetical protein
MVATKAANWTHEMPLQHRHLLTQQHRLCAVHPCFLLRRVKLLRSLLELVLELDSLRLELANDAVSSLQLELMRIEAVM